MPRLAHGCALALAALALLVMAGSASADTITTVAGGGTQDPPRYDQFNDPPLPSGHVYADPLTVSVPEPTGVAWSGDPNGLFYVTPGAGRCAQLWVDPDPATAEYGLAIQGGALNGCNPLPGGYHGMSPDLDPWTAKEVLLDNPCCVSSNWQWDRAASTTGPYVASSDSGHVQFYRWANNTAITVAGVSPPANCADGNLDPVADGTAPASGSFCNISALAQQGFNVVTANWWAFVERNRGNYPAILYWVDSIPEVHPIPLDGSLANLPSSVGGLAWDQLTGISLSDGVSAIHRLQYSGGSWIATRLAGATGSAGFSGDGGAPINARFDEPNGLAVGFDNALYIADTGNCRVRKISKITIAGQQDEVMSTVAGNGCNPGAALGDGGVATQANLDRPMAVAMASTGLLIADTGHDRIRLVDRTSIIDPISATNDTTPAFDIRSLDTPSHIECKVDGTVKPCNDLGTLGEGQHTLTAQELGVSNPAVAPHPPDPTPASATFVVDTTPPSGIALGSPAADAGGVPADAAFSWTAGIDTHAGIDHYDLLVDGAKDREVGTGACSDGTCVSSLATALGEGAHTWQVRAVDRAGNAATTEARAFSVGSAPTAAFTISPNPALAGRNVTFNGGTSSDESGIVRYEWDLDGDGNYETDSGASATTARLYQVPTTITVRLRVTDGTGKQGSAQQQLRVSAPAGAQNLLGISINAGAQYTRTPDVTLLVKPPTSASSILVSNDGGFLAPLTFPVATAVKWRLASSGPERLPKTVYARFMLGPIISETYTDDIILDEKPPVVQQASLFGMRLSSAPAVSAAAVRRFKLRIRARDTNSGVSRVQVTATKRKPGKLLRYKRTLIVRSAKRPKFVRARDRAGNFSRWKKLR